MQSSRGRPLTTSGSKFNQLALPIIGLRLDRQPLRARWLALEPGIVNKFPRIHTWKPARFAHCSAIESSPKRLRPALGGELAARDPIWDGEGWGCDRIACPVISCYRSWALAVATAGRPSPSETQTFGSLCH